MAVLVTGGAGFIGSHLVDALVAMGERVVVFDNLVTGRFAHLRAALESSGATFVYADVAQPFAVSQALYRDATRDRLSVIFHLASPATTRACNEHPLETLAVNGYGTMELLKVAQRSAARFLFASLADAALRDETSAYAASKRFGEAAVRVAAARFGVDARIVRIDETYGPRMLERHEHHPERRTHVSETVAALLRVVLDERPVHA